MKKMKLGSTGTDISRMGLGTWSIGGGPAWGGDHDLKVVVDLIRECPKLGVNLIDTAPGYNFGNSEKIVGKALEGMNREDVVIITKCGIIWNNRKGSLFNKVATHSFTKTFPKNPSWKRSTRAWSVSAQTILMYI